MKNENENKERYEKWKQKTTLLHEIRKLKMKIMKEMKKEKWK